MATNNKSKWFVEREGKIYGPLSSEIVERALRLREIVPINQITDSSGRWRLIRDEPEFKKIVRQIKEGRELEFTKSSAQDFGEHTKLAAGLLDQLLYGRNKGSPEEDEDDGEKPPIFELPTKPPPEKKVVFIETPRPAAPPPASNRTLLIVSLILFCGLGLASLKRYQDIQAAKEAENKKEFMRQVQDKVDQARRLGEYDKALAQLQKGIEQEPYNAPLRVVQAQLLVAQNKEEDASKILEIISDQAQQEVQCIDVCRSEMKNLRGLISLHREDLPEAEKNFLEALQAKVEYVPAHYNLGYTRYLQGDFSGAESEFLEAVGHGGRDGIIAVGLTRALAAQIENSTDAIVKKDLTLLDGFARTSMDYRQEILLGKTYLSVILADKRSARKWLEETLNTDPGFTGQHVHDPTYNRKLADWENLQDWCTKISGALGSSSVHMGIFNGLCAFKAGNKLNGLNLAEKSLSSNPRDPLILSLYGYIQESWGRHQEAKTAFDMASKQNPSTKLPFIFQAQGCLAANQMDCFKKNVDKIAALDPQDIYVLASKARLLLDGNQIDEAKSETRRGLTISANYRPLLKLSNDLLIKGNAL